MKRSTKITKPDAILTSDWHLRENQPVAWTVEFEPHQWNSVRFVKDLQEQYNCPVLHAGDLFHHWKPSPSLLSKTIEHLPNQFYTVYGNHDLPQHSMELLEKCGVFTLTKADKVHILEQGHWGMDPKHFYDFESLRLTDKEILVWHKMTYQGKKPWPDCTDPKAVKLLRQHPDFNLIVTGDNHESFVEEYEGRLLVNPGSLTRQTAKQIDFKPSVYLYFAENNTVERVFIPIEENVISREHLEITEAKDARIDAFISTLNEDWQIGLSFTENLKKFQQKNKVKKPIMEIIYKAIEI